MIISSPDPEKVMVTDYDFSFSNGMVMTVTIDLDRGDSLTYTPTTVEIHLVERPHPTSPKHTLPSEDISIYISHLLSVQSHKRELQVLTPEQTEEWKKTLQELGVVGAKVN
jgi:hypothetical protein